MVKHISKDHIEYTLVKAEEVLNLVGYIPMISLITAAIRSFGGMLQLILGACFAAYYFFLLKFFKTGKIQHLFHLKTGLSHVAHGFCNVMRAKIEAIPFLSLIICLPYDRLFRKRFKYSMEKYQEGEEIII